MEEIKTLNEILKILESAISQLSKVALKLKASASEDYESYRISLSEKAKKRRES